MAQVQVLQKKKKEDASKKENRISSPNEKKK